MVEHIAKRWIELHNFGILQPPGERTADRVEVHFIPSGRAVRSFLEQHQRPGEEPRDTFIRSGKNVVRVMKEKYVEVNYSALTTKNGAPSQAAALVFFKKAKS